MAIFLLGLPGTIPPGILRTTGAGGTFLFMENFAGAAAGFPFTGPAGLAPAFGGGAGDAAFFGGGSFAADAFGGTAVLLAFLPRGDAAFFAAGNDLAALAAVASAASITSDGTSSSSAMIGTVYLLRACAQTAAQRNVM